MKIVLICQIDNKNVATGIVAKKLIDELKNQTESIIVCNFGDFLFEDYNLNHVFNVKASSFAKKESFVKLIFMLFKYPLHEVPSILKAYFKIKETVKKFNPDITMVISHSEGLNLILLGDLLSKASNSKFYVHSTDPIPAPSNWYNNMRLHASLVKSAKRILKSIDYLSLSNKYMLDYELKLMGKSKKNNLHAFVVRNPSELLSLSSLKPSQDSKIRFLYLGNIYYKRQPDMLIKVFLKLAEENPNFILQFAGIRHPILSKYNIPSNLFNNIELLPYSNEPMEYLLNADVLVDFDAPFKNDVYISSKVINYLSIKKPIFSLTPENSPTSKLLESCVQTTVVANYEEKMVYDGLLRAYNQSKQDLDFSERNSILEKYNVKNIVNDLLKNITLS